MRDSLQFDSSQILTKDKQSKTPVTIIVGKQDQIGFIEKDENGKVLNKIFLNQYEARLLLMILRGLDC